MDANAVALAGVPVLCIDTCSLLDIMRDPTRETVKVHERQAAIDLVSTAEAGKLKCVIAKQVAIEFAEHDQLIQDEAARNLKRIIEQITRINMISAIYGVPGIVDMDHLDDHVRRARAVVERWLAQLDEITPSRDVPIKAFARVNSCLAPARRGKESSKDCLIYETYLEAASALRAAGVIAPIVFLSSNTKEYFTEGGALKPDVVSDFQPLNLIYAPNMSAAKHKLGL